MKAKEIFSYLLERSVNVLEPTCDRLIAGDPEKEVKKIGTCFKLTAELIEKAGKEHIDMIVTHEPTFAKGDNRETAVGVDLQKWTLLDQSGLVVYRFHDHAHHSDPDYIHAGFIRALDLKIAHRYPNESLGICRYDLETPGSVGQIAKLIEKRLGAEFVRVVGDANMQVKTLGLALGSIGFPQIHSFVEKECDLFITGEVGEVCTLEYVRDACYFGNQKAVILFGHFSAEYAGMRLLAQHLNDKVAPTVYLHSGEVYSKIV